ncbi:MAG: biotin carboxylase N-terminal domain-containing protein [Nitrososphaeraceae archaeon]
MNTKLLIANRGEIAIRIANACKKVGIGPCGIYSEADRESLHIKYCDETIDIGGSSPLESYLAIDTELGCGMIQAARSLSSRIKYQLNPVKCRKLSFLPAFLLLRGSATQQMVTSFLFQLGNPYLK